MVNIVLCGNADAEKLNLIKRIKTLRGIRQHEEISRDVIYLRDSEDMDFHTCVVREQCRLEDSYEAFVTNSSTIDSLVHVHHYIGEEEAMRLSNSPEVASSIQKYQSSLVLLVLTQPCSYTDEKHRNSCESIADLYRSYFHSFSMAYLELRSPDLEVNIETIKKAIEKGQIPLETTRLQKYQKGKSAAKLISHTTHFVFFKTMPGNGKDFHVPTIVISEHESEQRWTSYPQGETNRFILRHGVQNLALMSFHISVKANTVQFMLKDGVTINGSVYSFLGCSSSGLKERKCYLWKGSEKEAQAKLAENGDFDQIPSLSKRMARIGLLFSGVRLTGQRPSNIVIEDDIERNGKCFTDGCGGIGINLARRVYSELKGEQNVDQSYLPSVYQVRIKGYKGVLAVDPSLDEDSIKVRPSMRKFETTEHQQIGVCGYSQAHTFGHLNKQFIMLLSGLGICDNVFIKKQQEHFENVLEMGRNREKTIAILQWKNKFDVAQMIMRHQDQSGFAGCDDQIMKCIYSVQGKLMSKSEKLSILIPQSRTIYGVCDPTRTLEYGECFLRVSFGNLKKPKTVTGQVVVCKNPCYLLGDVQVLQAVDVGDKPEAEMLNHLVDCIVFPVRGRRPHPDEIAGSDLDGDEYFVTWDSDLIPPETRPAYEYPASKTVSRETSMIHYFAKQNETQKLTGKVDGYFQKWANSKGVKSDECETLGMLFSRIIDSSKTGEAIDIPQSLKPPNDTDKTDQKDEPKYVWQKMFEQATKHQDEYKANVIRNCDNFANAAYVSQSFVDEVLGQEFSNITEFEKFTFALNHLTNDVEKVLNLYGNYINFALFSQEEKNEALLLGVPKAMLENALNWSILLSHEDLDHFKMQTYRHPWSFYFKAEHEMFDWKLLLRALTKHDQTFIVFGVPDGITVVLEFLTKCKLGREQKMTAGTICGFFYSKRFGYRYKYVLGADYTLDLTTDTLQLYRNQDKTLTFVWLNASDCMKRVNKVTLGDETVNAISVNLLRFNSAILRDLTRPHPLVNKLPFLEIEVFAHNNSGIVPYFDIYDANDVLPVPEVEEPETETEEDVVVDVDTMMLCDDTYCIPTEEEFLKQLEDTAKNAKPCAFKKIHTVWRETEQNMPREIESYIIQLLGSVALSVPPLSLPEEVKDVLKSLVQSIEYKTPEGKFEILGLLSTLGLEDSARRLCQEYGTQIEIQRQTFLDLINKWQLWWLLDMDTAKLFLSKLHVHDKAHVSLTTDSEGDTDNQHSNYIAHFGKLQLMDLLHEFEGVKQKISDCMTDGGIANLKVLKRKDEKEETLTFYRSSPLQHNPKITKGQHVAVTRQSDSKRCKSFRSYCCVAQVVSVRYGPINIVVKISGKLPSVLKENIDPNSEKCSLWRISLLGNVTTHSRVVHALSSLVVFENEKNKDSSSISPDLLDMLVHPGAHIDGSPLSKPIRFCLPNNVSGLHVDVTDFTKCLNLQQQNAVISAVEHKVSLIHGPPGTGKTTVACHIIKSIHNLVKDCKILVVAETNIAVDNIVKNLKRDLASDILRVGSEGGIDPDVFDVTLEGQLKMLEEREAKKTTYRDEQGLIHLKTRLVQNLLRNARIVLATCSGAGDTVLKSSTFEFVLVDEATQTKETTLLCSLGHGAKHLVMIGDPKQLGPVAADRNSSTDYNLPDIGSLSITLFHRLYQVLRGNCVFLDTQHRMHPALMKFPSQHFYDGKLVSAIGESTRDRIIFPWPDQGRPLCFINIEGKEQRTGTSFCNPAEVEVVQNVLKEILSVPEEKSEFRLKTTEVGILSLYQGQVVKIRNTITYPVEVCSIDGFQGREKELIIVSTVRANERGSLGFVDDENRINVLLTRAKRGLIVIGNENTLIGSETWSKWLSDAPKLKSTAIEPKCESNPHRGSSDKRGNVKKRGRGRTDDRGGHNMARGNSGRFQRKGDIGGYDRHRNWGSDMEQKQQSFGRGRSDYRGNRWRNQGQYKGRDNQEDHDNQWMSDDRPRGNHGRSRRNGDRGGHDESRARCTDVEQNPGSQGRGRPNSRGRGWGNQR